LRILGWPFLARRSRLCAGVYLSQSAVAIAAEGPAAERIRCAAAPLDGDAAPDRVLKALCAELGIRAARATLVLPPESYHLLLVEQPNVAAADLRDAVRWRIQEFIDFPAESAVLEVFPFPSSAIRGRAPMVFVVAIARVRLAAAVETVARAGLEPAAVDIAELALRNLAMRAYPSPEHGIALLRITASSGIVNVTRGDELFLSRRIAGVPKSLDGDAWDAFKDALLLQVQRSIDYYESGLSQPPATALLVAATHGWQERIVAHLSAMLPLPVRSLAQVLDDELRLDLFNPGPVTRSAAGLGDAETRAIAAASPALGGLLRAQLEPSSGRSGSASTSRDARAAGPREAAA